jgi:hypothetical protein
MKALSGTFWNRHDRTGQPGQDSQDRTPKQDSKVLQAQDGQQTYVVMYVFLGQGRRQIYLDIAACWLRVAAG